MLFFLYEATKLPLSRIDLSILLHCSMAMVIIKDYSSNGSIILKKSQKARESSQNKRNSGWGQVSFFFWKKPHDCGVKGGLVSML